MAERDKVIKSGQITLPRILFLGVVGAIIVFTVYSGGVYLSIGYWFLTLAICTLLFLIAIDYGVNMEKVDLSTQPVQAAAPGEATAAAVPGIKVRAAEARPKRRSGSRPPKRRR